MANPAVHVIPLHFPGNDVKVELDKRVSKIYFHGLKPDHPWKNGETIPSVTGVTAKATVWTEHTELPYDLIRGAEFLPGQEVHITGCSHGPHLHLMNTGWDMAHVVYIGADESPPSLVFAQGYSGTEPAEFRVWLQ